MVVAGKGSGDECGVEVSRFRRLGVGGMPIIGWETGEHSFGGFRRRNPLTSCLGERECALQLRAAGFRESLGMHQFFVLHDFEHFRGAVSDNSPSVGRHSPHNCGASSSSRENSQSQNSPFRSVRKMLCPCAQVAQRFSCHSTQLKRFPKSYAGESAREVSVESLISVLM